MTPGDGDRSGGAAPGAARSIVVIRSAPPDATPGAPAEPFVSTRPDGPYRYASQRARRRALRRRRRRRTVTVALLVAAAALAVGLSVGGGGGAPAGGTAQGPPAVTVSLARTSVVPPGTAAPAPIPWTPTGESAVAIPALGYAAQSGPETEAPVASLTKLMTAYVILRDHPIAPGSQGPPVTITTADAWDFGTDTSTDQESAEIVAGEVLTEYQLLEGLLVHSANDFAYALASWDAGSVTAFVTKMNAAAARLGMDSSHFADASGWLPGSESTAADLLKVASADMGNPVFAQIVRMSSVTLPVAGTLGSFTPLLTTAGVVGVKSGYTSQAGGGDVLAYQATVGEKTVLVLAAVTGQQGPTVLTRAGHSALSIAQAALTKVVVEPVVAAGAAVGHTRVGATEVPVVAASSASLPAVAGDTVSQRVVLRRRSGPLTPGSVIGTATFRIGTDTVAVPVRVGGSLHRS